MPRPLDVDYLQPGEKPILVAGRARLSALDGGLGLTVLLGLYLATWAFARAVLPAAAGPLLVGLLVLGIGGYLLLLVTTWWRVVTSRYVITPERAYSSHGRWRFRLLQTTYDKVTDLHVRQSLFGRRLGFGDVTVQTAGTGLHMEGVRDPFGVKRRIEEARSAFIAGLVGEHRAVSAETAAATQGPAALGTTPGWAPAPTSTLGRRDTPPLWRGGPTFASVVGGIIPGVVFALFALVAFGAGAALGEPMMLAFGGFMILMGSLTAAGAVIQYRHTRYEVADWGVVVTSGWLSRKRVETTYSKVTDITTQQGILGRIFDFGSITINTAGSNEAPVVFTGLAKPEDVKQIIDAARERSDQPRRRAR